jgi:hypothetical protein
LGNVSDILAQEHVVKSLDFNWWRGTSAVAGLGREEVSNPVEGERLVMKLGMLNEILWVVTGRVCRAAAGPSNKCRTSGTKGISSSLLDGCKEGMWVK